jgi:hypothetical protein
VTDTVAAGVARVSMWAVGDSQIHPKSFGKICHLASGEEGSRESKGLFVSSLSRHEFFQNQLRLNTTASAKGQKNE